MQVGGRRLAWWGRAHPGPSPHPTILDARSLGLATRWAVRVSAAEGRRSDLSEWVCPSEDGWGLRGEEGRKEAEGKAGGDWGGQETGVCLWPPNPFPASAPRAASA